MGEGGDFYQPQCRSHSAFREEFIELRGEVKHMTTQIDDLVRTHKETCQTMTDSIKGLSEKQQHPEISKAWLIFYGVLITSGVSVVNALIANYDKIQKALGGS